MDKSKYRQPTALTALVIVLAITLYLQFFSNTEQKDLSTSEPATSDWQVEERRETTAFPEASESSAPDELPTPAQSTFFDKDGLFATVEWRNRGSLSRDEYPQSYAELRVLAEAGDVEATRRLTEMLRGCRRAFLDRFLNSLKEVIWPNPTLSLPISLSTRLQARPPIWQGWTVTSSSGQQSARLRISDIISDTYFAPRIPWSLPFVSPAL